MADVLVLFDLDGTLVDLNPGSSELEVLRSELYELALLQRIEPPTRSIFGMYEVLRVAGLGPQANAMIAEHELLWARESAKPVSDLGGIQPEHPWGIVTNNSSAAVTAVLERNLLFPSSPICVVTRDLGLPLKPDPAPLQRAVELAGGLSRYSACIYVGDSHADAEAFAAFRGTIHVECELRFASVSDRKSIADRYHQLLSSGKSHLLSAQRIELTYWN